MRINSLHIHENSLKHVLGEGHEAVILDYSDAIKGEDFWGNGIESVVAIVGNNGSGKSSILNGIKNGWIEVRYDRNIDIPNSNNIIVYYSPFMDDSNEYSNQNNQIDISKYYTIQRDTPYETMSFSTVFEIHKSQQTWRIIRFIIENQENGLLSDDLRLPLFQQIKIKANFIENRLHNTSYQFRVFFEEIDNIINRSRESLRTREGYEYDDNLYQQNELKNYLLKVVTDKLKQLFEITGNRYLEKGILEGINFNEISDLQEALQLFVENARIEIGNRTISLPREQILSLTDLLISNIPPGNEISNTTEFYVGLEDASKIIKAYQNFLVAFSRDFNYDHSPFLKFTPSRRLSSGEESMYNFLSLLADLKFNILNRTDIYDIRQEIDTEQNLSILLLLDEADLDFHPLWKKKFVNTLLNILPKIFTGNIINIVFTTHDPLTLSDIPSNNIFYLENENEVSEITTGKLRTFAANVNDLLSEAFFVKDGLIGDFAKGKIQEILTWINANKEIEGRNETYGKDLNKYMELISIIDEPITKLKLAEMLGELDNSTELEVRLINLEIEKLNRMKDNLQ